MRTALRAGVLVVLVLDSALLALGELLFLPQYVGSVRFPVTVLVAAVATPVLVRRAADVSPRPLVAAAPLLTWFVVVLGVGLAGPGGDVVLPPDLRSFLLLAAGILPAAVVLGRVRLAGRRHDPVKPPGSGSGTGGGG